MPETPEEHPTEENRGASAASRRDEEVHLHRLADILPDAMFINLDDRIVFCNPRFLELIGAEWFEQVKDRSPLERFHPDCHPLIRERIRLLIEEQRSVPPVEEKVLRLDGSSAPVSVSAVPIEFQGRSAILVILRDLTAQRQAAASLEASEERFRLLVEGVKDYALFLLDAEGNFLTWNAGAEAITGFKADEVLGRNYALYFTPEDRAEGKPSRELRQAAERGSIDEVGWRVRKDGSRFWSNGVLTALYHPNGLPRGFAKVTRDLTEHREAERNLALSEAKFRHLADDAPVVIWETDEAGRCVYLNRRWFEITGSTPEGSLGLGWLDFVHPEDRRKAEAVFQEAHALQGTFRVEYRLRTQAGDYLDVLDSAQPSLDAGGQYRGYIGSVVDVSELKRSEEDRAWAATLVQDSQDAVVGLDLAGNVVSWNPSAERMFGYTQDEALGRHTLFLEKHARGEAAAELLERLSRGERVPPFETTFVAKSGQTVLASVSASPIRTTSGRVVGFSKMIRDVSEQRKAREEQARLLAVLSATPDYVEIVDDQGRRMFLNRAGRSWLGIDEAEDLSAHPTAAMYVGGADNPSLRIGYPTAAREGMWSGESEVTAADGRTIPVSQVIVAHFDGDGQVLYFSTILRDLSDHRRMEEQLRQSQRMDAIGRLAGGVAHDFNNLLVVINGYSEMLLSDLREGSPGWSEIRDIRQAGERAAALTRQLLAFGRKQVLEPVVVNLNDTAAEVERLLRRIIGEDVLMSCVFDPNVGPVRVDPVQMERVLTNLAVNARDAMPQGGRLTIETRDVTWEEEDCPPDARPGRYVMLSVADTGCGMTAEVRSRLFEPYFTTKPMSKGTGLGLAMVFGVIKQSGGFINVYSEVGRGSCFKIYLPVVDVPTASPRAERPSGPPPTGRETILLVEDEPAVRRFTLKVLESLGYTVLEASSGPEALELVSQADVRLQLLLTDVVMPGMSGRELSERLHQTRPDLKVLYMSGYTDDAVVRHGILSAAESFIAKPFSPTALARKIRQVLDEKKSPAAPAGDS